MSSLAFMETKTDVSIAGQACRVTRCGYTGEDGVEVSILGQHPEQVFDALMALEDVQPAGLGKRCFMG